MGKLLIIAYLKTESQIHIGSGEKDGLLDSKLFRSVDERIILPGTSIAGTLRSRALHLFPSILNSEERCEVFINSNKVCSCSVCNLFGNINPNSTIEEFLSSKILVHDIEIEGNSGLSIRDGVGINRDTKTSNQETSAKFDYETIPVGTDIVLKIECEDLIPQEEYLLAALISEIDYGRIYFGGKSSRGLGRLSINKVEARRLPDLQNIEAFIELLDCDDWFDFDNGQVIEPDWYANALEKVKQEYSVDFKASFFRISGKLEFADSFLTKDSFWAVASSFDALPQLALNDGSKTFLSGSSIRGVIRSQAERIIRSLANYLDQDKIWDAACDPLCEDKDSPAQSCGNKKDGARDCLACKLFGSKEKGSRLKIADALEIKRESIYIQDFLAVDRFTGGGCDTKKFDSVVTYKPIYNFELILQEPELWEIGLLLLVINDINDGLISFGSGASKGFGKAKITSGKITVMSEDWCDGIDVTSGIFNAKEIGLSEIFSSKDADRAVQEFNHKLRQFILGGRDND
ncbi:MAG: RAMP superfamily CRISPR-associated protein [Peptococcales bacterium]